MEQKDVLAVLAHDHREVETMVDRLQNAGIGDARTLKGLVDDITVDLARHLAATEEYLYPVVRRMVPDGGVFADLEIAQNSQAEHLMKDLEGMQPADAGFDIKLQVLVNRVHAHIDEEERVLFPQLARVCTPDALIDLGKQVTAAEKAGPTRPHPAAPHRPPANLVTGPLLGLLDRIRDALSGRATK
jgi:hemerythrin superfamily protein